MDFYVTFPVAVALAMDAFAVAVASGSSCKDLTVRHAVRMALFFGGFQAFMPLLGALAGLTIRRYIQSYDHWVAFALLCGVGVKMIYESFKVKTVGNGFNPASVPVLLGLSVATSID
ncbi:MAG TPA: hypothetical protein ENI81_02320, partial [Phycisphaerales bacterium]|nr:hypothetical protein [Phycisphaerales bacterium]